MHLQPERGFGSAPADKDPLDAKPMCRGVFEHVPRAAGCAFVEGSENVAGTVRERKPDDRASGPRVLERATVPLPVVTNQQPLSARWNGGGLLVEDLIHTHTSAIGFNLLAPGKMSAIPVEDRTGCSLTGLDRMESLDRRIGKTTRRPGAKHPFAALGEMARARADDHRHIAIARRAQAEHAKVRVDSTLGDGRARIIAAGGRAPHSCSRHQHSRRRARTIAS